MISCIVKKYTIVELTFMAIFFQVWKLSDVDKDGMLDDEEFALAMHLINIKLDGHDLPEDLPLHLVPPSKRIMMIDD